MCKHGAVIMKMRSSEKRLVREHIYYPLLLACHEDYLLCFGLPLKFGRPIGVGFNVIEPCRMKVMHGIPVCEKTDALTVVEDMMPVRRFYHAGLVFPDHTMDRVEVAWLRNFEESDSFCSVFVNSVSAPNQVCDPVFAGGEGIVYITD